MSQDHNVIASLGNLCNVSALFFRQIGLRANVISGFVGFVMFDIVYVFVFAYLVFASGPDWFLMLGEMRTVVART